jgi:ubiquitin-conjugating enzyme (huntingtin interacting protein 2)
MQFDVKIWHPNVSSVTGAICLDTLKTEWSPALTIRTALLSILAMLSAANPEDPQDGVVAKQYMGDRPAFDAKAREWTLTYAQEGKEPPFQFASELSMLVDMGFERAAGKRALEVTAGNVEKAITVLTK